MSAEKATNETAHHKIDPLCYEDVEKVAESIRSQIQLKEAPVTGIICGSGLGELADVVEEPTVLPYNKIPGFPPTTVVGHKGNLVFGYLSGKYVMCVQGRFHPYEHGMNLALCAMPVRVMHLLGVKILIVSNAAGGVNTNFQYGDLMLIKDHIFLPGLVGSSPFTGSNDPRFGARFVSVQGAYDNELRKIALEVAKKQGVRIHEGVYMMTGGPQYETPAELRMLKAMGADAIGMSTCHEVIVARQCQIRVLGFSLITNVANLDLEETVEVKHEEVLQIAKDGSQQACSFVAEIVGNIK